MAKTLQAERVPVPPKSKVSSADMKIGDIAFVGHSSVDGYLYGYLLRTYDRYVSLNEPEKTWRVSSRT
jgi:hypothetical protein